jgi:hypothetical protein
MKPEMHFLSSSFECIVINIQVWLTLVIHYCLFFFPAQKHCLLVDANFITVSICCIILSYSGRCYGYKDDNMWHT